MSCLPLKLERSVAALCTATAHGAFYRRAGVYAYALAYALVIVMPVFVSNPGNDSAAQIAILIYSFLMWAFAALLVWIFRLGPPIA